MESLSPNTNGHGETSPRGSSSSVGRINTVTYRNATIKAQIDTTMMVSDVIRQLCANAHLGVQEPPALFALRDEENDELIQDSNLARKIQLGRNFKLTASPLIEAAEMVDKLSSPDERILKMATYTLQRLIREPAFTAEFLRRGGLQELVTVVHSASGNTLAYALTSCQNFFETNPDPDQWDNLGTEFIAKVVRILVSQERVNVCRPATAILKKFVVAEPSSLASDQPQTSDLKTLGYGFSCVYEKIHREPAFLTTLVHRLGSADATLCLYSLSLINSLMRHVTDSLFDEFTSELERLATSKAVARLMDSPHGQELSTCILEYQSNVIRVLHKQFKTPVAAANKRHITALTYIWRQARIQEQLQPDDPTDSNASASSASAGGAAAAAAAARKYKWRRLGFAHEMVAKDFQSTGWLGLETCEAYVRTDPDAYSRLINEQLARPANKRCPWGRASVQVVEILGDHWDITSGSGGGFVSSSTHFTPFLLSFQRVHRLALHFFLRMWTECGATCETDGDFQRVSAMVRSQVQQTFPADQEDKLTWSDVDKSFLESEYQVVRDRQLRELQSQDDLSERPCIRGLRSRLYRESFEFLRQQRIQCLLEGAWLRVHTGGSRREVNNMSADSRTTSYGGAASIHSTSAMTNTLGRRNTSGTLHIQNSAQSGSGTLWRFYRLSPNKRYLHYIETSSDPRGITIRSGLDDLPDRHDLSQLSEVRSHASLEHTFTLTTSSDSSLITLLAKDTSEYAEWVDGLNLLLSESEDGKMQSETVEYINHLTDIALKVKLLDLSGEKLQILQPSQVQVPALPSSLEFFFAEL
ncbi:unnamed protein product [Sympodiomycopsis kandeliae]